MVETNGGTNGRDEEIRTLTRERNEALADIKHLKTKLQMAEHEQQKWLSHARILEKDIGALRQAFRGLREQLSVANQSKTKWKHEARWRAKHPWLNLCRKEPPKNESTRRGTNQEEY